MLDYSVSIFSLNASPRRLGRRWYVRPPPIVVEYQRPAVPWSTIEAQMLADDAMSRAARQSLGLYCPHGYVMEDCVDDCPEVAE